jgi:hypothetical protein
MQHRSLGKSGKIFIDGLSSAAVVSVVVESQDAASREQGI